MNPHPPFPIPIYAGYTMSNHEPPSSLCPICGAGAVLTRTGPYNGKYNQEMVHLESHEFQECAGCEEVFYTPQQAEALSRKVRLAASAQLGVLPPQRLLEIRERLGVSQAELETLLGLGPKVITRWETGRVIPGRAADKLMRVLEREPRVLELLRELNADKLAA